MVLFKKSRHQDSMTPHTGLLRLLNCQLPLPIHIYKTQIKGPQLNWALNTQKKIKKRNALTAIHCSDLHYAFCNSKQFIRWNDCSVKLQHLFRPFFVLSLFLF